ncbi:Modification methylase MboII [Pseudoclavibacter triregionum]|nr:Modification methylase MboII [Pseudoclavibacter triregionum]
MARRNVSGRLELTWMGKDKALIPSAEGVYDYDWVDKNDPRACQTHYLIDEGHVGDPDDGGIHDNLLVTGESGDVLEALTRVPELAEKYVGRVKCVYIDPPFNTEKTFTHYEDNLEHSVWLTMMRDRLVLLKKLLADDGSIWVHLDDSENHRMRVLLDEVFGSDNFVAEVTWEKTYSPRNDAKGISSRTDVILVYGATAQWSPNRLARTAAMDARYSNPDGDPNGPWKTDNAVAPGAATHQGMVYAIEQPITGELIYPPVGSCWRYGQEEMLRIMRGWSEQYGLSDLEDDGERARRCGVPEADVRPGVKGIVVLGDKDRARKSAMTVYERGPWPRYFPTKKGEGGFARKVWLEALPGRTPENLWLHSEVGHTDGAKKEILTLFPHLSPFATPKPESLLTRIIEVSTAPGDIVLDCFAGSGTTAAVSHKLSRRWVTCELLPETVAAFTRARLEKVVAGTDLGGVSTSVEYAPSGSLPPGTSVEEARTAATVINRAARTLAESGVELDADTLKALKEALATKKVTTTRWSGGGGFDVARLSPVWVGVANGSMFTTEAATGEVLARSIAAHLQFRWTGDSDPRFAGRKGGQRLAVVEGLLTAEKAEELRSALEAGETVTVACFGAEEGVDEALRRDVRGSRVLVIPDDLFAFDPEASEEVES